jgi:thiomorpholine-carboxylate dehydrogenase
MSMLFLDDADVRRLLDLDHLIDVMEQALQAFSAGSVVQPVRQMLPVARHRGYFGVMPAVVGAATSAAGDAVGARSAAEHPPEEALGIKLVTFYPGNAEHGLATHRALVALFAPGTGEPLAVMDGTYLTEMRTAAVSAAATRRLARPEARVLAVLGSGVQARSHVELLRRVRPFEEVRVWSRNAAHASRMVEEERRHQETAGGVGPRFASCACAEDAVRGADVVVVATSATEPVLRGAWLETGAHVNAVGACVRTWRELDDDVMRNVVYVDSRAAANVESGDVILSRCPIWAELGELFAGAVAPRADETTVFKSLGLAVEDVAAARLVLEAYRAHSHRPGGEPR